MGELATKVEEMLQEELATEEGLPVEDVMDHLRANGFFGGVEIAAREVWAAAMEEGVQTVKGDMAIPCVGGGYRTPPTSKKDIKLEVEFANSLSIRQMLASLKQNGPLVLVGHLDSEQLELEEGEGKDTAPDGQMELGEGEHKGAWYVDPALEDEVDPLWQGFVAALKADGIENPYEHGSEGWDRWTRGDTLGDDRTEGNKALFWRCTGPGCEFEAPAPVEVSPADCPLCGMVVEEFVPFWLDPVHMEGVGGLGPFAQGYGARLQGLGPVDCPYSFEMTMKAAPKVNQSTPEGKAAAEWQAGMDRAARVILVWWTDSECPLEPSVMGAEARRRGAPAEDCPFDEESEAANEWHRTFAEDPDADAA